MTELATTLRYLRGAGPARAQLLEKLELTTFGDLMEHYPRAYLDRTRLVPLGSLRAGQSVTATGEVRSIALHRARARRGPRRGPAEPARDPRRRHAG